MDRLRAMEVFVRIVECGSMSRAAADMGVSPTTISSHLAQLEAHLGRRLLDRSTRRIDLTEDGRQYLADIRPVIEAASAAEDRMLVNPAAPRGRVRIDVPAAIGHAFVLPALPRFLKANPAVEMDLILGDRPSVFRPDGFDVLVRVGRTSPSSLADVHLLGSTRFVQVASPGYLARRGVPRSPRDLEQHDCILYSTIDQPGGSPWTFERDGKVDRFRPRSRLKLNDGAAISSASAAGLGIARTLANLVVDEIAAGMLVPVLEDWTAEPLPISAVVTPDRSRIPVVTAAVAFLQAIGWSGHRDAQSTAPLDTEGS